MSAMPMETAPRDGTMLRLLVRFTEHATDDAGEAWTIGSNSFDANGEDEWKFAGWCWTHDHFTEGKGTPLGWLPMIDERAQIPESLDPLRDLYRAIGVNASGAGIDNDKRPTDFKAGMVKAYEHCLEMVRNRLTAVAEVKRQIAAAQSRSAGDR